MSIVAQPPLADRVLCAKPPSIDWSQREWWTLAVALAWIINPRLGLHPRIANCDLRGIARRLTWAWVVLPQELRAKVRPHRVDFDGACGKLLKFGADGKIQIRGIPKRRGGWPIKQIDALPEPPQKIPAAELEFLRRSVIDEEDCLQPVSSVGSEYGSFKGRFWHQVMVSRVDLMAQFHSPAPSLEVSNVDPLPVETVAAGDHGVPAAAPAGDHGTPAAEPAANETKKRKGGRPEKYHRETFERDLKELFEKNGAITPDDKEWQSVGQVVEALAEQAQKERPVPGDTWLKEFVTEYLKRHPHLDGRKPG